MRVIVVINDGSVGYLIPGFQVLTQVSGFESAAALEVWVLGKLN